MGEYEKAIMELNRVVDVNPKYIDARIKLAVAWYKKGEVEKAKGFLKETLEFAPDNEKVKMFLKLTETT